MEILRYLLVLLVANRVAGANQAEVEEMEQNAKRIKDTGKDFDDGHQLTLKGYKVPTHVNGIRRKEIIEQHNQYRTSGKGSNTLELIWDDDTADLAQGMAQTCIFGHNDMEFDQNHHVSQNVAWWPGHGEPNIHLMIEQWQDEEKYFDHKTQTCTKPGYCNHYLVMNYYKANQIGCGIQKCQGIFNDFKFEQMSAGWLFVCDYSPRILMSDTLYEKLGPPCSGCNLRPGTRCEDGLCRVCTPGTPDCREFDPDVCEDDYYEHPEHCEYWRDKKDMCDTENPFLEWMWRLCPGTCQRHPCDHTFPGK